MITTILLIFGLIIGHNTFGQTTSLQLTGKTNGCQGDSICIYAQATGPTLTNGSGHYNFYLYQGTSPTTPIALITDTTATFCVTIDGTYSVLVVGGTGSDSKQIIISINPLPIVNLSHMGILCSGDTNIVQINSTSNITHYNWSTGDTSQQIDVTTNDYYAISVTDNNGCNNSDSIEVIFRDSPTLSLIPQNESCPENNDGILTLTTTGSTTLLYDLSGPQNLSQTIPGNTNNFNINNLPSGNYSIIVTDGHQCSISDTFTISEPDTLKIDSITNSINQFNCIVSGGSNPYSFLWSNGSTSQTISANTPGNYQVIVTDNNGCTDTSSIMITVTSSKPILSKNKKVTIYPNQTSSFANIEIDGYICKLVNLYNQSGQLIKQDQNCNTIDLSPYSNGVYIIEILTTEKKIIKRIIKL